MLRSPVFRVASAAIGGYWVAASAAAAPAARVADTPDQRIGLASSVEGILAFAVAIAVNLAAVMIANRRRASLE